MSQHFVEVAVRRMFGDSEVNFTARAENLTDALAAAHTLAGMDSEKVGNTAPGVAGALKAAPAAAEAKPEKPKAAAAKKDAPAASSQAGAKQETTTQPAAAQEKTSSAPAAQPSGEEVTYDGHVKPAILTIAKEKGRDTVTALLQRFGAGKGPELKPEQFAEFHALAQKTLAGEYDPMAAEEEALA